jgi:hypothetical protein
MGAKRPKCDIDYSLLSSAEVKNDWNYTCISTCGFVQWRGITYRNLPLGS